MWRTRPHNLRCCAIQRQVQPTRRISFRQPLLDIKDGTFYPEHVSDPEGLENPSHLCAGINISIPSRGGRTTNDLVEPYMLGVTAHSAKTTTTFLKILAGQYVCRPPTARTFPYLAGISRTPQNAVQYVGFDAERGSNVGGNSLRGAYLSARYESRREELDFTVREYLHGETDLNALDRPVSQEAQDSLEFIINLVGMRKYLDMPVTNLSNGQTRRVRIARAFMKDPELVIIDGPFMGLDPFSKMTISEALRRLSHETGIRLVLGLTKDHARINSELTDLVALEADSTIFYSGVFPPPQDAGFLDKPNMHVLLTGSGYTERMKAKKEGTQMLSMLKGSTSRDGFEQRLPALPPGPPVVNMRGVKVAYGNKVVLGDWIQRANGEDRSGLWWSLHRGQRCGIFGPNGSGKTTMLSLITSDHPQTYSLPIEIFGRSRLPDSGEPGISLFDIQKRMGHSSPEVHAFFPKQLTVRRAITSAWADAPLARPHLTEEAYRKINACLRWFARELNMEQHVATQTPVETLEAVYESTIKASHLDDEVRRLRKMYKTAIPDDTDIDWARQTRFGELSFSNQRLVLFLRAIVAEPALVILDEAFSGMDSVTRDRAQLFLSHGERISRVRQSNILGSAWSSRESALIVIDEVTVTGLSPDQALLVISHNRDDVPGCVREWICLPEPGEGRVPRTGMLPGPLELNPHGWDEIWGLKENQSDIEHDFGARVQM